MPATLLQALPDGHVPTFLTLGHVTRDLLPGETFLLGGTVTFAALTASHLGLAAAVVTCGDEALLARLSELLPGIALAARPAPVTTTFENSYVAGFRTQYLRARAPLLALSDIPPEWLDASIVLLAPLAQEVPPDLIRALARSPGSLLAATPQGWLRRWDADGRIWPTPWEQAEELLPLLDVLILSHDDLLPFASNQRAATEMLLADWSRRVPLLLATDGGAGAVLFERGKKRHFPAYRAVEVDPTGAGDVFAAAFLAHFYQHHDPYAATNFANCAASLSIEHPGYSGIPTLAQIQTRLTTLPE